MSTQKLIAGAFWILTLALFAATVTMVFTYTPVEKTMGVVQKIFYLLCAVVLITGMIWGKSAWGQWWTWSPRLTFSLVLFLLYVVYLMIRPSIESPQRRAVVCAVYGIVAFLDVPLVYLSVKMLPDIHPESIALAPEMKITLLAWFLPVTMFTAGLILARFRLNRRLRVLEERRHTAAHQPAIEPVGGMA